MAQQFFGLHGEYPYNDTTVINSDDTVCLGNVYLDDGFGEVICSKCDVTSLTYFFNGGEAYDGSNSDPYIYFANPHYIPLDNTGVELPSGGGGGGGKYPDPDDPPVHDLP